MHTASGKTRGLEVAALAEKAEAWDREGVRERVAIIIESGAHGQAQGSVVTLGGVHPDPYLPSGEHAGAHARAPTYLPIARARCASEGSSRRRRRRQLPARHNDLRRSALRTMHNHNSQLGCDYD